MPRLLFSSLPSDLTTNDLARLLASPPIGICPPSSLNHTNPRATDVKVLLNKFGRSRRMAFVGYKSHPQAAWIKQVWEGVWVDAQSSTRGSGSRISVQWAKGVDDGRASDQPLDSVPSEPSKKKPRLDPGPKIDDPLFNEFLSLAEPRKNKSLVHQISRAPSPTSPTSRPTSRTSPPATQEPHPPASANHPLPNPPSLDRSPSPIPVVGDEDDLNDQEYLARRMKRKLTEDPEKSVSRVDHQPIETKEWAQDLDQNDHPNGSNDAGPSDDSKQPSPPSPPAHEACILETGRLFLRNLEFSVTEEDIRSLFEPFGSLAQVHILFDHQRKPKGLAYVSFDRPSDALEAYRKLDQSDFQGRLLHILPAVTRNPRGESTHLDLKGKRTVKQEQDAKRKLESSKQFNWATLYMNSDAVASSVANRLKIDKADLFDPEAQHPAIKLALAETHVINETKQYLQENGVDLEAFERFQSSRSPTTILVKNIPYGTSINVIKALFSEHGSVIKALMPPSGTIAVIEMGDGEDAKSAFRALSYKRIGNSVLYLEKAPQDLWKSTPEPPRAGEPSKAGQPSPQGTGPTDLPKQHPGEPGSTLFVKNLSFGTTPETLASRFSSLDGYLFSRIQTKPDPKRPGHRLSMGFGFIGFRTVGCAQQAIQRMQGCHLDGHSLELKFARRGRDDEEEAEASGNGGDERSKKAGSNKLMIKNLPFEINKQELRELFGAYGKLKSVRLPKKIDRRTRGFGFVEYQTKKEAQEALKSLKFSHLLGRHLVIEFAHDSDPGHLDLDRLRDSQASIFKLTSRSSLQKKKFIGLDRLEADDDQDGWIEP